MEESNGGPDRGDRGKPDVAPDGGDPDDDPFEDDDPDDTFDPFGGDESDDEGADDTVEGGDPDGAFDPSGGDGSDGPDDPFGRGAPDAGGDAGDQSVGEGTGDRPGSIATGGDSDPGPGGGASAVDTAPEDAADEPPRWWVLRRLWALVVAIGLGIGGFVVAFVVFQVLSIGFFLAGISLENLSFVENLILTLTVLQGISFPLVALMYMGIRRVSPLSYLRVRLPDLRDLGWVVGGFLLVIALVTAVLFVVSTLDAPQAERTDTEGFQENPSAILLMVPLSILLIGPAEELLFRGVIQTRLRETYGPAAAVVLANAAFAPLHIFALSGSLAALAVTIGALFVPGLVFGTTYELTDNLAVPSLIHGLYNATIFTLFYVSAVATVLP